MARIISIHEYELKPGSDGQQFEQVIRDAEARSLLRLPGLIARHFVKGTKGARRGVYAAVWIYESRELWEQLWGTPRAAPEPTRVSKKLENLRGKAAGTHFSPAP